MDQSVFERYDFAKLVLLSSSIAAPIFLGYASLLIFKEYVKSERLKDFKESDIFLSNGFLSALLTVMTLSGCVALKFFSGVGVKGMVSLGIICFAALLVIL